MADGLDIGGKVSLMLRNENASDDVDAVKEGSAGHELGQLVGMWWEQYIVLPLLTRVADRLGLYLDCQFRSRACRGEKAIWRDADGQGVDYDFVLELGGSNDFQGIPVGFIEVFWRRGSRHSKDKARDDTGKLLPMRETYPTARFLGILACGDFTVPAREYVLSRQVDLFYVRKDSIVQAFGVNGLRIDYPDKSAEAAKRQMVEEFRSGFSEERRRLVASSLLAIVGRSSIDAYVARIESSLAALPQEIRFFESQDSAPSIFTSLRAASDFLQSPVFFYEGGGLSYRYEITYSDGTEFVRDSMDFPELQVLHNQVVLMSEHMERVAGAR